MQRRMNLATQTSLSSKATKRKQNPTWQTEIFMASVDNKKKCRSADERHSADECHSADEPYSADDCHSADDYLSGNTSCSTDK